MELWNFSKTTKALLKMLTYDLVYFVFLLKTQKCTTVVSSLAPYACLTPLLRNKQYSQIMMSCMFLHVDLICLDLIFLCLTCFVSVQLHFWDCLTHADKCSSLIHFNFIMIFHFMIEFIIFLLPSWWIFKIVYILMGILFFFFKHVCTWASVSQSC